jgi:hypothetical protein
VCHSGSLSLALGGSYGTTVVSNQDDYYVIDIPSSALPGNLHVYTTGDSCLIGELTDSNCDYMNSNGSWSSYTNFSITSSIGTSGKYWIYVSVSITNPGTNYTIYAEMI